MFTGTLTAYTTPQLLGGNQKMMMSTFLYQKANTLGDWQSASVLAFIMILTTLIINDIVKTTEDIGEVMNPYYEEVRQAIDP